MNNLVLQLEELGLSSEQAETSIRVLGDWFERHMPIGGLTVRNELLRQLPSPRG
ncbi:MAG TPA: hypothetical protein VHK69_21065 [Chitinophagaceae bacterium]|jgi:hypothetical protein|nr:hypothetical protein [Chitinophagaceae bacterium]